MLSSSTFGQIKFLSSRVDGVDHDDNDGKIDDEERYTRPTNNGHFRDSTPDFLQNFIRPHLA